MKTHVIQLILIFFIGVMPFTAKSHTLRRIGSAEGLTSSAVLSLFQDQEGKLWFGTYDGVFIYDGQQVIPFEPKGKQNLNGNIIENITQTTDGVLWILTNYGLNKIDRTRKSMDGFSQFQSAYRLKKNAKDEIFILSENYTLHYTAPGNSEFVKLTLHGLKGQNVIDFYPGSNYLWALTNRGLYRYALNPDKNKRYTLETCLNHYKSPLLFASADEKGNCFTVNEHGIVEQWDLNDIDQQPQLLGNISQEAKTHGEIASIQLLDSSLFVAFKTNGVLKYTLGSSSNPEDTGIRSGIFTLLKDREQDIMWIASDGQGVFTYAPTPYTLHSITYADLSANIGKPIRSLFIDYEKTLWLGTKGEGILRIPHFDTNCPLKPQMHLQQLTKYNSALSDNSVFAFAPSRRPLIWIGTDHGLCYYSHSDRKIHSLPNNGKELDFIHQIYEESDTVLWLASVGKGIVRIRLGGPQHQPDIKNLKRYTIDNANLSSNYFFAMTATKDGKLLVGNRGYGVFALENENLKSIPLKGKYTAQTLNDIFAIESEDTVLWLGSGQGVIRQTPHTELLFDRSSGFRNATVHAMQSDSQGKLWIATNSGLIALDKKNYQFQTFDLSNGMKITEFSDGAAFRTHDALLFGGINGFVVVKPDTTYRPHPFMPRLAFTRLRLLGDEVSLEGYIEKNSDVAQLTLNHDQNYLSLSFIVNDYINWGNYTYLYRTGNDDEWIDNGTQNTISFTRLAHGSYPLQVKYRDRTTGYESDILQLNITIRPPWYLSPFAYLIYLLAAAGTAYYMLHRYIRKQKRHHQYALARMEQEHKEEIYEEKLRFFTNITHEFCTPLTLIYGPCERILEYNNTDAYIRKYILLIRNNARRLNSLIQEVIDFRRLETGHQERHVSLVAVSQVCHELMAAFTEEMDKKQIKVHEDIEDTTWNTDLSCFGKIAGNLLSNAFKYTPNGGIIHIKLYQNDNQNLTLSVYNTGKGIRPEDRKRIFNRYAIIDNGEDGKGAAENRPVRNGLGMAICHSMVELLEGKIEITSEVGQYTQFTVTLPWLEITEANLKKTQEKQECDIQKITECAVISEDEMPIDSPNESEAENLVPADNKKQHVLIIDDNHEILTLVKDTLKTDYHILTATNGDEGLALLKKNPPALIITDIMMPGTDGIALTKQIKQNKHTMNIPLIILSAKNSNEEKIEGLQSGADAYISKPFSSNYLKAVVDRLIENEQRKKEYYNSSACAYDFAEGRLMPKEDKALLQAVTAFLADNIENSELTPDDLAAHLQISTRNLYRKFKELEQPTPKDFIKDYRINIAAKLLRTTTLTVQEIIYRCGFNNRSHFYKEFDKRFQITPKDYRNNMKQKDDSLKA